MSLQLVKASQYPSTTGAAPATAPPFFTSARAKMGAMSSAASISRPWKKSVQHTALKPPRKV